MLNLPLALNQISRRRRDEFDLLGFMVKMKESFFIFWILRGFSMLINIIHQVFVDQLHEIEHLVEFMSRFSAFEHGCGLSL